jgi:poly(hydroxyalkanoate) depolymerase family esterase
MKLNEGLMNSMQEALALLRTSGPLEATEAIQRALRGQGTAAEEDAGEIVRRFADGLDVFAKAPPGSGATAEERTAADTVIEDRGHFSTRSFANAAGARQYRLYVPAGYDGKPVPLIVMLHGCTQDADDFAAGTQMNALAEQQSCIVAYPVQPQTANPSKCWNWFRSQDQRREQGEPSLIAGITREIMASHSVDPQRVYVAGLSAGGAMAAVMLETYPELYAAAGVHSGLPYASARDLPSALAAMKGGKRPGGINAPNTPRRPVIVFHGDADSTVHPLNARELVRGFSAAPGDNPPPAHDPASREFTVKRLKASNGAEAELWTIHGAPHAWSGGSRRGSYTDPSGPDASAQMLRFFLANPKAA